VSLDASGVNVAPLRPAVQRLDPLLDRPRTGVHPRRVASIVRRATVLVGSALLVTVGCSGKDRASACDGTEACGGDVRGAWRMAHVCPFGQPDVPFLQASDCVGPHSSIEGTFEFKEDGVAEGEGWSGIVRYSVSVSTGNCAGLAFGESFYTAGGSEISFELESRRYGYCVVDDEMTLVRTTDVGGRDVQTTATLIRD
jgi:hypothetical protein